MTWFRRDERISWIEVSQPYENIAGRAFALIDKFLSV
jgi:hypothetical protein